MSITVQWGKHIVSLEWEPGGEFPAIELVTSVHGICKLEDTILLVRNKDRRFHFPGGHLESGEDPVQALLREIYEEGYVRGDVVRLVGRVRVDHTNNPNWNPSGPYPLIGYQLFYLVKITEVLPFQAEYESVERIFVHMNELHQYNNPPSPFLVEMLKEASLL
jgi:8-oxo-dGTP diphosphatase